MLTDESPASNLSEPSTLLAIARAAHLVGDRELERVARRLLRERYDIKVTFRRPRSRPKTAASERGGPCRA